MFGVVERGLESARDDFGLIGASIAIRVNCVEQMRWLDDECAARTCCVVGSAESPWRNGAWCDEAIKKHVGFVKHAIAIGVGEHLDSPSRTKFVAALNIGHVARHLDDPQFSIAVEGECDWRFNEWLGGREFGVIPRGQCERRKFFARREWKRRCCDAPFGRKHWLRFAFSITVLCVRHRCGSKRKQPDG